MQVPHTRSGFVALITGKIAQAYAIAHRAVRQKRLSNAIDDAAEIREIWTEIEADISAMQQTSDKIKFMAEEEDAGNWEEIKITADLLDLARSVIDEVCIRFADKRDVPYQLIPSLPLTHDVANASAARALRGFAAMLSIRVGEEVMKKGKDKTVYRVKGYHGAPYGTYGPVVDIVDKSGKKTYTAACELVKMQKSSAKSAKSNPEDEADIPEEQEAQA